MKSCSFALFALLAAGCATSFSEKTDAAAGYRGIEEVRVLAKGME